MSGQCERKVVQIGGSQGITLPKDWLKTLQTDSVYVIYDHYLLVVPGDDEEIVSGVFRNAIRTLVGVHV